MRCNFASNTWRAVSRQSQLYKTPARRFFLRAGLLVCSPVYLQSQHLLNKRRRVPTQTLNTSCGDINIAGTAAAFSP